MKNPFKQKFQQFAFPITFLGQSSKALHFFGFGFCCSFTEYENVTVDCVLNRVPSRGKNLRLSSPHGILLQFAYFNLSSVNSTDPIVCIIILKNTNKV